MKKIKLFPLVLLLCLVFTLTAPGAWALEDPELPAAAALLVDLDSERILYEKNKDAERAPASLTKVMTVLLALEAIDEGEVSMDDMVTAQSDCRSGMNEYSSTVGIRPGMTLSLRELLYCALLSSANEACNIIGTHVAGSISAFVERMNAKAEELGCVNTGFANTHGMPAYGHYTTAYDLYLITREAMRYPDFMEICNTTSYQPELATLNGGKPLISSNALLTDAGEYGKNYVYEYASGVKTGYTRSAGYCLISTAEKDGVRLLAVIMGCNGPLNSNYSGFKNFEATISLYDWAFDNYAYQTLLSADTVLEEAEVEGAEEGVRVELYPAEDLNVLVPADLDADSVRLEHAVFSELLRAPIDEGQVLGEVSLFLGEDLCARTDLISGSAVAEKIVQTPPPQPEEEEPQPAGKSEAEEPGGDMSSQEPLPSPALLLITALLLLLFLVYFIGVIRFALRRSRRRHAAQDDRKKERRR